MANYCDKTLFLEDIIAYKERKKKNPDEQIPDYSAKSLMLIAEKMANRPNFAGYSFKADMISDGIYVCLKYFDKFDVTNAKQNPFGYFSKCIWFSFLQRIARERKQTIIKSKILAQMPFELFDVQDQDIDEDFRNSYTEFLQEHNHDIEEPKKKKQKDIEPIEGLITCWEDVIEDGPEVEAILTLAEDVESDD